MLHPVGSSHEQPNERGGPLWAYAIDDNVGRIRHQIPNGKDSFLANGVVQATEGPSGVTATDLRRHLVGLLLAESPACA